jgi:hypothetical protein
MNLSTRVALAITIALVGIGMRFWIASSGGAAGAGNSRRAAADMDALCAESLAAPNHREAREWCSDPSSAGFEMSRDDMLKLAEEFYTAGAEKVYVTDIEQVEQSNVSASMVVVLPTEGAARKNVFKAEAKFAERIGEAPIGDIGQKYVMLSLD